MTNPLLIPQPMSPEQVADLVERTRVAEEASGRMEPRRRRELSERAARWAHAHRMTCAAAARRFGRSPDAVCDAWHRLFPEETIFVRRRP